MPASQKLKSGIHGCRRPRSAFERAMIRERTRAGLAAARAQGRIGGRRPKLREPQKAEIVAMVASGRKTAAEAARLFGVHPSTVSRLLGVQWNARPGEEQDVGASTPPVASRRREY